MTVHGLLLAAGAGSRMGQPKALIRDADGTSWLQRSVGVLRDGGCARVTVVLGASYDEAAALVPDGVSVVRAIDWESGMAASLWAGLTAVSGDPDAVAALVHLVDLPDVDAEVVRRMVKICGPGPQWLARATYAGRPGHPVLVGREHWPDLIPTLTGDVGARRYLDAHHVQEVECGDRGRRGGGPGRRFAPLTVVGVSPTPVSP